MSRVASQAEQAEITEQLLVQKMYDRYRASMNGMQVILGKVKDNWRHAHLKGVSSLHVLDKFSIALQLDRRIVQGGNSIEIFFWHKFWLEKQFEIPF